MEPKSTARPAAPSGEGLQYSQAPGWPLGRGGKPEMTSRYPRLHVAISPPAKAALDALIAIERKPIRAIVEKGIQLYVDQMPREDRRMVEAIAKRAQRK